MRWYNANLDNPPENDQEVLISVNGIYYLTIYDAEKNLYWLRDQEGAYFGPNQELIYWAPTNTFANTNATKE